MRLDELLVARADTRPGAIAFHWVDRERQMTYGETAEAMERAAAALAGLGVGEGDRVGIFAHPGLDYVVALFASWRLGATAAPVDLAAADRLAASLSPLAPRALVYTNDHFAPVQRALPDLPVAPACIGMDGPQDGTVGWAEIMDRADPATLPEVDAGGSSPALVSGPGHGGPEGAATHDELLAAAGDLAARVDLTSEDRVLCPTALSGRFHLSSSILPAVGRGASAAMFKSWADETGWDAMERNETTVLCAESGHCLDVLRVSAERGRAPGHLRIAVVEPHDGARELVARFRVDLDLELVVAGPW